MNGTTNSTFSASKGCLTGTGRSLLEAKAHLESQISAALDGSYDPIFLTRDQLVALGTRTPDGWITQIRCISDQSFCITANYNSAYKREQIEQFLRAKLAINVRAYRQNLQVA